MTGESLSFQLFCLSLASVSIVCGRFCTTYQCQIVSTVSGYTVCGLYTVVVTSDTVFDPRLANWITTFYSIAVVQSAITTGLMAYRIWNAEKRMAKYRTSQSNLRPVLWILVESASLQFFVELVLLALYAANYNCQYLMLEPVTPLVVSSDQVSHQLSRTHIVSPGHHFHSDHSSNHSSLTRFYKWSPINWSGTRPAPCNYWVSPNASHRDQHHQGCRSRCQWYKRWDIVHRDGQEVESSPYYSSVVGV